MGCKTKIHNARRRQKVSNALCIHKFSDKKKRLSDWQKCCRNDHINDLAASSICEISVFVYVVLCECQAASFFVFSM